MKAWPVLAALLLLPFEGAFAQGVTHTLVKGDTCWALSERYLGNPMRWREIARLNPHIGMCDHKKMAPGVVIRIPDGGPEPKATGGRRGARSGQNAKTGRSTRPRKGNPARASTKPGRKTVNTKTGSGGSEANIGPNAPETRDPNAGNTTPSETHSGSGTTATSGGASGTRPGKTGPVRPPDARLEAMQPEVNARAPKDPDWASARTGMDLYRGWRVNTLEEASADISFSNNAQVRLRENTLVIIYGDTVRPIRRQTTSATLDRGALLSHLDALAGQEGLKVVTPSVEATLREGRALVDVSEKDGTTRVVNHAGKPAEVKPKGSKAPPVKVAAGTGTVVRKGKRPTPPKPLPPPTAWSDPGPLRFIASPGSGAEVSARWAPAPKATGYRVELSRAGGGRGAVAIYQAPANIDRFKLVGISPGRYAARVSVVVDGMEGPPSRALGIDVGTLALDVSPQKNAEGQLMVAMGNTVPAPDGMLCTLGGAGTPQQSLLLTRPGVSRLMCTDTAGRPVEGPTFQVTPVQVALAPGPPQLLTRAQPKRVFLRIDSVAELPQGFGVFGPPGVQVQGLSFEPTGVWGVNVTPGPQSSKEVILKVVTNGADPNSLPLGEIKLPVLTVEEAAAADPLGEESIIVRDPDLPIAPTVPLAPNTHAQSTLARLGSPRALAVLDDAQRASRYWAGSKSLPQTGASPEALMAFGAHWHLLGDRRLRLEVGHVRVLRADLVTSTPAHLAGTWLGQGIRFGEGRPWSALVSLEEWVSSDDTQRLRLRPSASVSWRPGSTWVLRTRQGLSAGVDVSEWIYMSGYGVDVTIFDTLALGVQGTASVGRLRGESLTAVAAGPVVGLHLNWLSLTLAGESTLAGDGEPFSVLFALELKFD
ncbi:MAG: FecR domain-containing protein [Bradymonadia bacterium]